MKHLKTFLYVMSIVCLLGGFYFMVKQNIYREVYWLAVALWFHITLQTVRSCE